MIALATVLTMGDVARFADSRKWVSYLGLNPSEESSGQRRRLGSISKQGNTFLRYLLVEGAASAVRGDKSLARMYARLKAKKHHGVAKVAVARKLAVRLYLMLREHWTYAQLCKAVVQVSPSHSVVEYDRGLEWAACLPTRVGSLQHESWEHEPNRWVARPCVRCR